MPDAPKHDTITVSVEVVTSTSQPTDPPPMPTTYVVRYLDWVQGNKRWETRLTWYLSRDSAFKCAQTLADNGARRVQIVTIPGDVK